MFDSISTTAQPKILDNEKKQPKKCRLKSLVKNNFKKYIKKYLPVFLRQYSLDYNLRLGLLTLQYNPKKIVNYEIPLNCIIL